MGVNYTNIGQISSMRDMVHTQVEVHNNVLLLDVFSVKIFAKIDLACRNLVPLFHITERTQRQTMGCWVS